MHRKCVLIHKYMRLMLLIGMDLDIRFYEAKEGGGRVGRHTYGKVKPSTALGGEGAWLLGPLEGLSAISS